MRTKEEYLKLIEETANYYAESPLERRATNSYSSCFYDTYVSGSDIKEEAKRCAVGRCMTEQAISDYGGLAGGVKTLEGTIKRDSLEGTLDTLFKDEYKGFPPELWGDLQSFHDCSNYWFTNGLTEIGRDQLNFLKNKWS